VRPAHPKRRRTRCADAGSSNPGRSRMLQRPPTRPPWRRAVAGFDFLGQLVEDLRELQAVLLAQRLVSAATSVLRARRVDSERVAGVLGPEAGAVATPGGCLWCANRHAFSQCLAGAVTMRSRICRPDGPRVARRAKGDAQHPDRLDRIHRDSWAPPWPRVERGPRGASASTGSDLPRWWRI